MEQQHEETISVFQFFEMFPNEGTAIEYLRVCDGGTVCIAPIAIASGMVGPNVWTTKQEK